MLVGDPAYKFIHVEDFGYVVSYNPRTSFGDFQTMLPVSFYFTPHIWGFMVSNWVGSWLTWLFCQSSFS